MPEPLYDVVVNGVQSTEPVEKIIKQIAELLHNHSKAFEFQLSEALIFNQNNTSVRESVPKREAEILRQQLQHLGVIAELQAALQLTPKEEDEADKGLHSCPACGHEQPKVVDGVDTCDMCGIVGDKYQNYRKRKNVLESEKRRLSLSDQLEARRIREQTAFNEE